MVSTPGHSLLLQTNGTLTVTQANAYFADGITEPESSSQAVFRN